MSRRVWVKRDNHRWKKLKHTQARDYYLLECERAAEDASWWAPFQSEGMSEGVFYGRKLAPYQDILLLRDTSGLSRSNNSASLQFGLISLLWFGHKRFKIWAWVCLYALAYLLQCVCTCVLRRGSVSCPLVCFSRLASSSFWRANPPPPPRVGAVAIFKAHLLIRDVSFFRPDRNASVARKQLRSGPARGVRKHLGRQTVRQG